jgi:major membrane immunogen (membrane-anchored lipoprotein)
MSFRQRYVILVVVLFVLLAGCSGYVDDQTSSPSETPTPTETPPQTQGTPNDQFESNDEFDTAASVSPGEYSDLRISEGESDFFTVELDAGTESVVTVIFNHEGGDLGLVVYGPSGSKITERNSKTDNESATFTPNMDGDYRIEVYGFDGASAPYTLSITQPLTPTETPTPTETSAPTPNQNSLNDRFEPNDEFDAAASVSPGEYSDLQIVEGESDYFAVELDADREVTVNINFDHGDGDLDLAVYGPDGDEIADSTSTSDGELVAFTPNTDGSYRVEVYGFDGASAPYALSISQLSDQSPENDRFEPNDEFDTAASVSPGEYSDLQIVEGESDYFAVELDAGRETTVDINFDHSDGDLDLAVYGPDGDEIADSVSTTDGESVEFTPNTDGSYRVEVYGYEGASAPYTLSIS